MKQKTEDEIAIAAWNSAERAWKAHAAWARAKTRLMKARKWARKTALAEHKRHEAAR